MGVLFFVRGGAVREDTCMVVYAGWSGSVVERRFFGEVGWCWWIVRKGGGT